MKQSPVLGIVTGASRGIGFEICRQLALRGAAVILTARDMYRAKLAADTLAGAGLPVSCYALDVTDLASIYRLRAELANGYGRLDVLVNNAGILLPTDRYGASVEIEVIRQTLDTNTFGPLRTIQAFLPFLLRSQRGRIINVSSSLGSLTAMTMGPVAYSLSKACLNMLTVRLAAELEGTSVAANCVCPGWVRTDMGGPWAPRSAQQGAETAAWLALDAPQFLSGRFLRDRQVIPW